MVLFSRNYLIAILCIVATSVLAFQFAWWVEEEGGFIPPGDDFIVMSTTFDGTLLRKSSGTGNNDSRVFGPSDYAPTRMQAFDTSDSVNDDPYLGWYGSDFDDNSTNFVETLGSGNVVGILTGSNPSQHFSIPGARASSFSPALTGTTWSVSFWMNPDAIDVGDVVFNPRATGKTSHWLYRLNATQFRWGSVNTFNYVPVSGWQLWCITSERKTYVNGAEIDDSADAGYAPDSIYLGYSTSTKPIAGTYDDFYFWADYILTSDNVTTLYNQGAPDTRSE